MSVPLTLGLPPRRQERPLLAALLDDADGHGPHPGLVHGVPVVAASAFRPAGSTGRVAVVLDVHPDQLDPGWLGGAGTDGRLEIVCARADLRDALALPGDVLVVLEPGPHLGEDAALVVTAGRRAGLPADADAAGAADFLAVLAHADRPFVARAHGVDGVLAVLAATAAALRGADVRAAWSAPDPAALAALSDDAGAAVREVLGSIEVPDPVAVVAGLAAHGLGEPGPGKPGPGQPGAGEQGPH